MIKEPNITTLKKYLAAMKKIKAKYVTSERLSNKVGIYPEIISETFSYFDPMVNMDHTYNLLELADKVEEYINLKEANKVPTHRVVVSKKEVEKYQSVEEFIYKTMSVGGFINRDKKLDETELRTLNKLIKNQLANINKKSRK